MSDNAAILQDEVKPRAEEEESKVERDAEGWMDTLSDLIFLMITFFVLLITMSSMDQKSLKKAFGLFDEAAGVLKYPEPANGAESFIQKLMPLSDLKIRKKKRGEPTDLSVKQDSALAFVKGVRDGLLSKKGVQEKDMYSTLRPLAEASDGAVQVLRIEGGIEVVIVGSILFPGNSTSLDDKGAALLKEVGTILQLWGGQVRVVAQWSWAKGPNVLTAVTMALMNERISGRLIRPQLVESMARKIRFVLRKEKADGQ